MSSTNDDRLRAIVARHNQQYEAAEQAKRVKEEREREYEARVRAAAARWQLVDGLFDTAIASVNSRLGNHLGLRRVPNGTPVAALADFFVVLCVDGKDTAQKNTVKVSLEGDVTFYMARARVSIEREEHRREHIDSLDLAQLEDILISFIEKATES